MRVSSPLATTLLRWLDALGWTSAAAHIGTCVAFDAGLCDTWDDLRWDAEHDRQTLGALLGEWAVDGATRSAERQELADQYELLRCFSDETAVPSPESQHQVRRALDWLRDTRLQCRALAGDAVLKEGTQAQQEFEAMLSRMCLDAAER